MVGQEWSTATRRKFHCWY